MSIGIFKIIVTSSNSIALKLTFIFGRRIRARFKGICFIQDIASTIHRNVVNLFIVYKLSTWPRDLNLDFTLVDCLFEAAKLTEIQKNMEIVVTVSMHVDYRFDKRSQFSLSNVEWIENISL